MDLLQFTVSGLTIGSVYAIIGIGYYLIYISTRVINFAQGALVQLGGVVALSFLISWKLPYALVFFITFFVAAILGIVFDKAFVGPAGRHSVLSSILMTVGGFLVFEQAIYVFWTKDELMFPAISGELPINILGVMIIPQALWIIIITAFILSGLWIFFNCTVYGSAIMAAAEKPEAARLVGINVNIMTSSSWALAAGLAGVAGILIAPITFAGGSLSAEVGIKGFVAVILGGITHPLGAVAGGLLLGITESLTTGYVSSAFKDAISFGLLIAVLALRPEGIMGQARREKV
ncbi:MAG: branched-chain amino acid ABC transporter permease [Desulfobacteraceae bacterium]|jgi:branched-chain amino acid transport system permease protein|nr:MAG: branched-chain amino acid ABC transporter permease [Desulfobacteraceae bacterium]